MALRSRNRCSVEMSGRVRCGWVVDEDGADSLRVVVVGVGAVMVAGAVAAAGLEETGRA